MEVKTLLVNPNLLPEPLEDNPKCTIFLLKEVFNKEAIEALRNEVLKLPFIYTYNDLHSMGQSRDFSELKLPLLCSHFHHLMHTSLKSFVSGLFSIDELSKTTMTASIYKQNDYLLCHDDRVGDRAVAFVYYLTENWTESDGGSLKFFNYDEAAKQPISDSYKKIISPEVNSMVLFRVNESSFHEVEEVFGTKPRLSINGWFHLKVDHGQKSSVLTDDSILQDFPNVEPFLKAPLFTFTKSVPGISSKGVMSAAYRSPVTCEDLAKELCLKPRVFAKNFLDVEFYDGLRKELKTFTSWSVKGPPFRRKYDTLEVKNSDTGMSVECSGSEKLCSLLNFLVSPFWLTYICRITGLELAVLKDDLVPPTCVVEVQRWKSGCYTALASNDVLQEQPSIEISLFFDVDEDNLSRFNKDESGSGSIVHIVKQKQQMNWKTFQHVSRVKSERMIAHCIAEQKANYSRAKSRSKWQHTSKQNYAILKKVQQCVMEKMRRMKEYRDSRTTAETEYITPENNSLLLTMNSKNTNKYTSYIKRIHQEDDNTRFYCVSLTYFTASSFDAKCENL